ncbi:DIX domain and Regulator of G protein signalling superfamily domain and Regulator of G-protein signalling, domain 1-containing protein [Strongyloides ratti]|uniref:DIX domain and Regulator of G protein signalling superfamily domain and Regulator of G-protein signalling, domain 1-containing protein n=1 Tax=Strongyloides ratti TaxID=34506 RepID=A0A090LG08_STRRB|nr:DIX domain and Regulator of G protein signalling superfamily domain and Regulator of G-protein signalling, domain 1-containing protein [Strongyloides ratti]CEF66455.1 DIX domain and Regulator of G protein signalling superfamily domain and Regulator of G-protein signalling, domain 1-containing protein [Strongyloides ratti]
MFFQDARIKWTECLENVLNDGNAVNLFTTWMKNDHQNSIHPIYLHFAIVAYKDMVIKGDIRSIELARQIYRRYLKIDDGLCQFIPKSQREQLGLIIKNLTFPSDINLFDNCYRYVDRYLRQQHANFVVSEEFINYFNQISMKDIDSDSYTLMRCSNPTFTMTRKVKRSVPSNSSNHLPPQNTNNSFSNLQYSPSSVLSNAAAELLLRKNDKSLGEETVNKLFPPVHKFPYACQVTTSQKDSTYSSSFSSDANESKNNEKLEKKKLLAIQEEHIRVNPSTSIFPQTQIVRNFDKIFRHDTAEGRKIFSMVLIEKLNSLKKKKEKVNYLDDRFKDIETTNKIHLLLNDSINQFDEDEDIDNYLKQKLENDASKPSSSQDSPMNHSIKGKLNNRFSSSTSPERPSESLFQQKNLPIINQTLSSPYGHNGFAPPPQLNTSLSYHRHSATLTHGHSKTKHYNLFNINQTLDRFKKDHETENVYADDTSGFCSMTTGSNFSSNKRFNNLPKSAIFKKAREMFTENKHDEFEKSSGKKVNKEYFSLPRQLKDKEKYITIGYKSKDSPAPYICYASKKTITFRDFRKYLSISSKTKQQFYFKTPCEEDSTPYQYVLISDDSTILPIYEGKIMAECRTGSESD